MVGGTVVVLVVVVGGTVVVLVVVVVDSSVGVVNSVKPSGTVIVVVVVASTDGVFSTVVVGGIVSTTEDSLALPHAASNTRPVSHNVRFWKLRLAAIELSFSGASTDARSNRSLSEPRNGFPQSFQII